MIRLLQGHFFTRDFLSGRIEAHNENSFRYVILLLKRRVPEGRKQGSEKGLNARDSLPHKLWGFGCFLVSHRLIMSKTVRTF